MTSEHATACSVSANPVSQEMMEAARMAGLDFILNVVVDAEGRVCSGSRRHGRGLAQRGVHLPRMLAVRIDRVYDDLGRRRRTPKDVTVPAQKARNAQRAVRPAEQSSCRRMHRRHGESRFEEWMKGSASEDAGRFAQGFELEGIRHTA